MDDRSDGEFLLDGLMDAEEKRDVLYIDDALDAIFGPDEDEDFEDDDDFLDDAFDEEAAGLPLD